MDFASLMSSQIASSQPTSNTTSKKYLKRSDIEAQRQADYVREQEEAERARLDRLQKKRKRDEEESERVRARDEKRKRLADEGRRQAEEEAAAIEKEKRKRLGLPELAGEEAVAQQSGDDNITDDAILQKLYDLGEPRKLFGETHAQRIKQYHDITSKALTPAPVPSNGPVPTTLSLVPEKEMKVPASLPSDTTLHPYILRQIASYFDMLLSEWRTALSRRPLDVKESFSGRQANTHYTTAVSNLTPLFRKLETNSLAPALLAPMLEIVHLAQSKRYVDANDAYLRLSIGKAAWPIGVTMVGIHERSAREKLHGAEKAHIMADETTRKMLQGIKRGLSFAQVRWPPEDKGQLMG